jgi:hypothetical protein
MVLVNVKYLHKSEVIAKIQVVAKQTDPLPDLSLALSGRRFPKMTN